MFEKIFEIDKVSESIGCVNFRKAVRGVIINNGKILMVHSKNGDYKFPGGGIKENEEKFQALKREIEEETGYICKKINGCVGIVTEKSKDKYYNNKIFKMISFYYSVEVSDTVKEQKLDKYEEELGFEPKWVSLHKAIEKNERVMETKDKKVPNWINRETYVLKELLKSIN